MRLQLEPKTLITFFPKFEEHERTLASQDKLTEEESRVLASLSVFLDYIRKNYRQTLARIASLVEHSEITFDLLYAILVPGTIFLRRDPITRETRAMRLVTASKGQNSCGPYYSLCLAGLEASAGDDDADDADDVDDVDDEDDADDEDDVDDWDDAGSASVADDASTDDDDLS